MTGQWSEPTGRADDRFLACVMIVDPDDTFRSSVVDAFASAGFRSIAAGDAASARALSHRCSVDAVVAGLDLPGMVGAELLGMASQHQPQIVAVAAAKHLDRAEPHDLFDKGFTRLFARPVRPERLVATVRELLGGGTGPSQAHCSWHDWKETGRAWS